MDRAAATGWRRIEDLKREGKIRFFGVSINDYQPDNALRPGDAAATSTPSRSSTTRSTRRRRSTCFPPAPSTASASSSGSPWTRAASPAGSPPTPRFPTATSATASSAVTGRRRSSSTSTPWSPDLGIEQDQIAEVALRYVLSRDAVSTVIAGMRTVRNVERNAAVGDGRGLSAGQQAIVARAPLGAELLRVLTAPARSPLVLGRCRELASPGPFGIIDPGTCRAVRLPAARTTMLPSRVTNGAVPEAALSDANRRGVLARTRAMTWWRCGTGCTGSRSR